MFWFFNSHTYLLSSVVFRLSKELNDALWFASLVLKQDLQTIKHHSTLSQTERYRTKQIRVGIEKSKHQLYNQMETIETS